MSATETKVQIHERIKREQNPWEELPRLLHSLRGGTAGMEPADLNTRLRWWGLYTQGDGEGAFGDAAPYFMLRVRIPNGKLTAAQTRVVAAVAQRHGRGLVDVTVRQNIQLHWLEPQALPEIFATLESGGLTSQSACGDTPRNVTGCPLAGVDAEEYADASPLAAAVNRALLDGAAYYNLPRKFKVCISGCRQWCPNPEINDAAFTALPAVPGERAGFELRVGGGLSSTPHLARALPVRVEWDQVVPVALALAGLFRDREELRQNRAKARLKFLFLQHGWTVERFRQEIEDRLGYRLTDAEPQPAPMGDFRDHIGVHTQQQAGLYYAGLSLTRGRLSAAQLANVADAADEFGGGEVRATAMQNLVIPHVPGAQVDRLRRRMEGAGLPLTASTFRRGVMACTGKEFCKLAVTETKSFAAELIAEMERRLPAFPEPLRINVNGCPNSCGQHWIADVGLQGTRVKTAGGAADGFDIFLGGGLGRDARLARRTLGRVAASELPSRLESLFRHFDAERKSGESFRDFVERNGTKALEAVLGTMPEAPVFIRLHDVDVALEEA